MFHSARMRLTSPSTASLLRDTVLYVAAKAVPGAIGLLSVVVFVRLLGVEEFGLFSLLASTAMMWTTFSGSWLNQGILRHCTGPHPIDDALSRQLARGALVAIVCAFAAIGCNLWWMTPTQPFGTIILTWLLGATTLVQTLAMTLWQAKLRPQTVLRAEMIRTVSGFGLSVVLALAFGRGHAALLCGTAFGYLLGTRFPTRERNAPPAEGGVKLGDLWHYGWPLSLWLGVQTAFPWLDRTSIASALGLEHTGTFASLSDVVTRSFSLTIFPLILAVHPRITTMWNSGQTEPALRLVRMTTLAASSVAAAFVAGFYLGAPLLARWLLPASQQSSGTELVVWLAVGGAIWQLALLVHKPLELRNCTRVMLVCVLVSLAVKTALNFALVPTWGGKGAALASVASGLTYIAACAGYRRLQRKEWTTSPHG